MESNLRVPQEAQILIGRKNGDIYYALKRTVDLLLAVPLLIILSPVMLAIAILIKLDSPGPVLFRQERVGARRYPGTKQWIPKRFYIYKFRTMRDDADPKLHQEYMEAYIAGDEKRMAELQPNMKLKSTFKLTGDPRVTRIGAYLRKTSLDELPQLWNVFQGNMSLVGPRPPIPYEVEMYTPEHMQRLAAAPGITGLWQVSGRADTGFEEMVELDMKYIEQRNIWLDIKIILLTAPAVLSKKGAG